MELMRDTELEQATQERGRRLLEALRQQRATLSDRLYDHLIDVTTSDEALKIELFRFVDTLPVLNSSRALNAHMHEYFGDPSLELAGPLKLGLGLSSLAPWLVGPVVRTGVKRMARSFITGRTGAEVPIRRRRG